MNHLSEVKDDLAIIKMNAASWLDETKRRIPWGTSAVQVALKPVNVVFLFDPGGSYPWATEDESGKYIYFDILKVRGFSDAERTVPLDPELLKGFLVHELFHLVQNDEVQPKRASEWLIQLAVAEGAASLFGNNAADSHGERLDPQSKVLLGPAIELEWNSRVASNRQRIQDFLALVHAWENSEPTNAEKFETLVKENWVSAASNGLLIGDIYRVGLEMLLDIRREFGHASFLEVIGNSKKLLPLWYEAQGKRREAE